MAGPLLDAVDALVIVFDRSGTVVEFNRACETLTGHDRSEVRGRKVWDALTPFDQKEHVRQLVERLRTEELAGRFEGVWLTRMADRRVIDWSYRPIERNGTIDAFLATGLDITDRRSAAEELGRHAEAMKEAQSALRRLAAIVEASSDAIFSYDLEGVVHSWNPGAERLYGYTASDMVGGSIVRIAPAVQNGEFDRVVAAIKRGWTIEDLHTTRNRKDGTTIAVSATACPLTDESGAPIAVSHIERDVTSAKRVEAELARARDLAEAATRAKSDFLANMSHEIRTPLTAVLGFADVLLDPQLTDVERLNAALTVRRNGEHLLTLVNDILDLSKIEAGKMLLERTPFSPDAMMAELSALLRPQTGDKGLGFEVIYETPIPASIEGDPTRVRQILLNLLTNALKFTERGKISLRVRYEDGGGKSALIWSVRDTGIGLSSEQKKRLFQPFSQADSSTTRRFGGTGLGLRICRLLADAMGGDLQVHSQFGVGSTFSFSMTAPVLSPATVTSPSESVRPVIVGPAFEAAPRLRGHVMVAEDGPDNQLLISSLLKRRGVAATIVENGALAVDQALAALSAGAPFDLILMDIQMPRMDGYEATRQLRKSGYAAPIVALTANAMAGERERCVAAGCDEYLVKPIDKKALGATLGRFLSAAGVNDISAVAEPMYSAYADDPDMADAVAMFTSALGARAAAIEAAWQAHDRPTLQRLAHQLKGAAGGFGFPLISEEAAALESALRGGQGAEGISACLASLLRVCTRVRPGTLQR